MIDLTQKENSQITIETAIFVCGMNNSHMYTYKLQMSMNTVQILYNLQWYTITQIWVIFELAQTVDNSLSFFIHHQFKILPTADGGGGGKLPHKCSVVHSGKLTL